MDQGKNQRSGCEREEDTPASADTFSPAAFFWREWTSR